MFTTSKPQKKAEVLVLGYYHRVVKVKAECSTSMNISYYAQVKLSIESVILGVFVALTSILGSISAALSSPVHVPFNFSPYQLVHEAVSTWRQSLFDRVY